MKTQFNQLNSRAFTLIEMMVVLVVIGIIAAIIIPQFIGSSEDAKVATAKASVAELESAVERFYVQMDRYPTPEEGLQVLVDAPTGDDSKKWRGPYIKQLRDDPWGHSYQYAYPGTHHPSSFDIWSSGGQDKAEIGNW
jgi:general secretion pathway protein G